MNDLKPCPFCGSNVVIDTKDDWYMFDCTNCECKYQTSFGKISEESRNLAIQEWNSRPLEDKLDAKIAHMERNYKARIDWKNFLLRVR